MTTQISVNETFDPQGQLIASETIVTEIQEQLPESDSELLGLIQALGESEKNILMQVLQAAPGGAL
jgi:hypothetical protein